MIQILAFEKVGKMAKGTRVCIVLLCFFLTPLTLIGQSNQVIDELLQEDRARYGKSVYLVLSAAEIISEKASETEAMQTLEQTGWKVEIQAADEPISLGTYSHLIMQAFDLEGGALYSLFPAPRFASRELGFKDYIKDDTGAYQTLSGRDAIKILGRVVREQETGADHDEFIEESDAVAVSTEDTLVISLNAKSGMGYPVWPHADEYAIGGGTFLSGNLSFPFYPPLSVAVGFGYHFTNHTSGAPYSMLYPGAGLSLQYRLNALLGMGIWTHGGYSINVYHQGENSGAGFIQAGINVTYHILPQFSVGLEVGYRHFFGFYNDVNLSIGATYYFQIDRGGAGGASGENR
jgi:hypothetical protein